MAGQRQVQPSAQAIAADGGDNGKREARDLFEDSLPGARELLRANAPEFDDLLDVGAGGKRFAMRGDDDAVKDLIAFDDI